jgi:hypothetical protein
MFIPGPKATSCLASHLNSLGAYKVIGQVLRFQCVASV